MNAESDERKEVAATVAPGSAAGDGNTAERELGSRAPGFIKGSRVLHLSWQVGIFVVGLAVVGAGIVMLPLPGPRPVLHGLTRSRVVASYSHARKLAETTGR